MSTETEKTAAGVVATDKAPAAIGPYSQAKVVGDLIFTSGQIAIDPAEGKIVADTIEGQTEQVCRNIGELLKAAGSDFGKSEGCGIGDHLHLSDPLYGIAV